MNPRRRQGAVLVGLAIVGILIAGYLTATKLSGEIPVCGPLRGCETVSTSPFSEIFGVPVALIGMGYSTVALVAGVAWWRSGDRRALYVLYGMGLLGLLERKGPVVTVLVALGLAFGTFHLFATLLRTPLPRGPLGL